MSTIRVERRIEEGSVAVVHDKDNECEKLVLDVNNLVISGKHLYLDRIHIPLGLIEEMIEELNLRVNASIHRVP